MSLEVDKESLQPWFRSPVNMAEALGEEGHCVPNLDARHGYRTEKLRTPEAILALAQQVAPSVFTMPLTELTLSRPVRYLPYEVLITDESEEDTKLARAMKRTSITLEASSTPQIYSIPVINDHHIREATVSPLVVSAVNLLIKGQDRRALIFSRIVEDTPNQHEGEYFKTRNTILTALDREFSV